MADPAQTGRGAVVMTSIAAPNDVMRRIAGDCAERAMNFIVIGDTKSPADFALDDCVFLDVEQQKQSGLAFAQGCPTRHYARKNIGYLIALKGGADFIVETDDDNMPAPEFYEPLPRNQTLPTATGSGWTNAYAAFDDRQIWPRGFPLDEVRTPLPDMPQKPIDAPIQQGLADENPDVDAIYRLLCELPFNFSRRRRIALGTGAWCPFNSQNTVFYREAAPLLYLPAHCSFRMTDIWRSFVAQRIAWANDWSILFREATVTQDRNDHDLMRDFSDEISGYTGNQEIADLLTAVKVEPGTAGMLQGLRDCYAALIEAGFVGEAELPLIEAWISDLADCDIAWAARNGRA